VLIIALHLAQLVQPVLAAQLVQRLVPVLLLAVPLALLV
jgi:hypothetical protein